MDTGAVLGERRGYVIRTLGDFCVLQGDERLPSGQARERALLLYLAVHAGRSIQREMLVDLLWHRGDNQKRRHGLSQLLYALKHRYSGLELVCTRDAVRLEAGVASIDALELIAAVDAGNTDAACELFGGPFLRGFYIDGVGTFEDWRESLARDLNGALASALRARLADADTSGRWWVVERTANQLLELDPYDEDAHARRVKAIAASGNQGRATRELDRAIDLIRRDLGRLPGRELRELIDRLGSKSLPDAELHTEPLVSRFVGRTAEFRELRHAWRSTIEGRGSAVAICGEAGIGKSRLCTHLLRVVAIEGGRVLDGRCFESSSQVPYGGIRQALSRLRDADLSLMLPHARQILAELIPEVSAQRAVDMATADAAAEDRRCGLFDAVLQLIRTVARRNPVAIFVDDLQWADASTTELLHYLARTTSDDPVMILVAIRPEELSPADLPKRIDAFRAITIEPLGDNDAAELVAGLDATLALDLSARDRQKIIARGAGRPFLIVELIRYLLTWKGESNECSSGAVAELPAAVEALLLRRLRDLSKPASHTVDVLAVLGGEATVTLLELAGRISPRQLVTAVEELQYRQIIQETGAAYAFTHDLMREAAQRRLSSARKRWLNRTAATALQRMPRAPLGTIALHMRAAGEIASAYSYALRAASHSQSLFAHSETTFFLRLAVSAAPDVEKRFDALDRLCRHLYSLADLPGVRDTLPELGPWYAAKRDRQGMLIAAVAELDSALYDGARPAVDLRRRAMDLAELIRESLDATGSHAVALILQIFRTAYDAGNTDFIATFSDAIHRQARIGAVDLNRIRHLSTAATAYGMYISAPEGYERASAALRRATRIADPASELAAQLACGATGTLAGMYAPADRHYARAWELSADAALQHSRRQVTINYAVLLMETGRLAEARELLEDAVDSATIHDRLFLFANLAFAELEENDWRRVRSFTRALDDTNRVLQAWWAGVAIRVLRGFVALAEGDQDRARTVGSELIGMIRRGPDVAAGMLDSSYTNILLARVGLMGQDDRETAAGLRRAAEACRSTNVGAAARLDLERGRVLRRYAPQAASKVALEVLEWAENSGARLAALRARDIAAS